MPPDSIKQLRLDLARLTKLVSERFSSYDETISNLSSVKAQRDEMDAQAAEYRAREARVRAEREGAETHRAKTSQLILDEIQALLNGHADVLAVDKAATLSAAWNALQKQDRGYS